MKYQENAKGQAGKSSPEKTRRNAVIKDSLADTHLPASPLSGPMIKVKEARNLADLPSIAAQIKSSPSVIIHTQALPDGREVILILPEKQMSKIPVCYALDIDALSTEGKKSGIKRDGDIFLPISSAISSERVKKVVFDQKQTTQVVKLLKTEPRSFVDIVTMAKELRADLPAYSPGVLSAAVVGLKADGEPASSILCLRELNAILYPAFERLASITVPTIEEGMTHLQKGSLEILKTEKAFKKSADYWMLGYQAERLRDELFERLEKASERGVEPVTVETSFGSAKYSPAVEIDTDLLRGRYPYLAALIKEKVTKSSLITAFVQRGINPLQAKEIIEQLERRFGYTEPSATLHLSWDGILDELAGGLEYLKQPSWPVVHVTSQSDLKKLAAVLNKKKVFSLDTETWGPDNERLDRDLCLIQIGVTNSSKPWELNEGGSIYIVDVVKLTQIAETQTRRLRRRVNPLEALRGPLTNPEIIKVAHHSQFEENQFSKYGIELENVVDTERETRKLRPGQHRYSLAFCAFMLLGLRLNKELQVSDWKHERSPEQINYAALDAEITLRVYAHQMLEARKFKIDEKWTSEQIIQTLARTEARQIALASKVGFDNKYWFKEAEQRKIVGLLKEMAIAEAQKQHLEKGIEGPLDMRIGGPLGFVDVSQKAVKQIDLEVLKKEHPQIAKTTIKEQLSSTALDEALRAKGMRTDDIEKEIARLSRKSSSRSGTLKLNILYDKAVAEVV